MAIKTGDWHRWAGVLPALPVGARLMLTAFMAIIAAGYLVAVANIYQRHGMADAQPGLSTGDIRAVYAGGPRKPGDAVASHMLTMLAGTMRQYVSSEADYATLETWLKAGGSEAGLDGKDANPATAPAPDAPAASKPAADANAATAAEVSPDGDSPADDEPSESRSSRRRRAARTPRRILVRDCLRCHAQSTDTDIARIAPFGRDEFDVDYAMLSKFIRTGEPGRPDRSPPQYDLARLVLISHQHMLAIPVFTLIVGVLFLLTRTPSAMKSILLPLPMLASVVDFSAWWLARTSDVWVYAVAGAGAVFGITLGLQILAVVVDLWRPVRPNTTASQSR